MLIPITDDGWDSIDEMYLSLYDVEFTDDFGSFKKGEKFSILDIDFENGKLRAYDEDAEEIGREQDFACVPKI